MSNEVEARNEYDGILKSGMFWEFFPSLSGDWVSDRKEWLEIHKSLVEMREAYSKNVQ